MKNLLIIGGLVVVLVVSGSLWSATLQSNDPDVIAENGLHWHPRLEIYVRGEKIEIPANIGIGPQYAALPTYDASMKMTAIHTHEDMPVIHLEFPGFVREKDMMLGNFFRIWGRDMHSFGTNVRMTVNGVPNAAFEGYIMRDKDIITLQYD